MRYTIAQSILRMSNDAMLRLHSKKEQVDLGRAGLQSGVYAGVVDADVRSLEDTVMRYTIAQSILDNIAQTESQLVVRDIFPDKDLLDGSGAAITSRDWRQPVSGNYASATGTYASREVIYKTGRTSNNDRKIISIYGLKVIGVGTERLEGVVKINCIIFSRPDVKTIDQWHLQILDTLQAVYGRTPLLFRRGDDMEIAVIPNAAHPVSSSKFDRILFLGKVVEPLGNTMTG